MFSLKCASTFWSSANSRSISVRTEARVFVLFSNRPLSSSVALFAISAIEWIPQAIMHISSVEAAFLWRRSAYTDRFLALFALGSPEHVHYCPPQKTREESHETFALENDRGRRVVCGRERLDVAPCAAVRAGSDFHERESHHRR